MRIEVRDGPNSPQMVVIFEEASNFDHNRREWIPRTDEVSLACQTFDLIARKEPTSIGESEKKKVLRRK